MNSFSVDGQDVYVATGGVEWKPGNPLLCLLHGAAMDHTVWTLFTRYFARAGYNVMAPDLCGHARSSGSLLPSIEAMADWLNALIDLCDAPRVVLCGHSMGSLVVLEAAARNPARVSHLALLGTAVPMRVGDALLAASKANQPASRDMVSIFGHAYAAQLGGNPVAGISVVNTALALMEQAGDDVMYTDMLASHSYNGGMVAAGKITARTTLVLGALDKMTPAKLGKALCDALPDGRIELLEKSGHMMMAEQPEETLQAMLRAFKR